MEKNIAQDSANEEVLKDSDVIMSAMVDLCKVRDNYTEKTLSIVDMVFNYMLSNDNTFDQNKKVYILNDYNNKKQSLSREIRFSIVRDHFYNLEDKKLDNIVSWWSDIEKGGYNDIIEELQEEEVKEEPVFVKHVEFDKVVEEKETLKTEIKDVKQQNEILTTGNDILKAKVIELSQTVNDLKQQNEALTAENNILKTEINNLKTQNDNFVKKKDLGNNFVQKTEFEIIKEQHTEIIKNEINKSKEEREEFKKQVKQYVEENKQNTQIIQNVGQKLKALKVESEDCKIQIKRLQKYNEKVCKQLGINNN